MTLPVGSLGIEGTIVAGRAEGDKTTIVLLGPGPSNDAGARAGGVTAENEGRRVRLTRPGYATVIEPGRPPTAPFQAPADILRELSGTFPMPPAAAAPEAGNLATAGGPDVAAAASRLAAAAGLGQEQALSAGALALASSGDRSLQDAAALAFRFADGIARWEDFRVMQGFGAVSFQANGPFGPAGGPCAPPRGRVHRDLGLQPCPRLLGEDLERQRQHRDAQHRAGHRRRLFL